MIGVLRIGALAMLAAAALGAGWSAGAPSARGSEITGVCGWPVRDSADLVNIAFPDQSAHYWGSLASGIPETGIVLRGEYPRARYFSLHTYNVSLGAYDVLTDREIEPSSGRNPFVKPAPKRGAAGKGRRSTGTWEVRILPGERPAAPAPNTLYTGSSRGIPNLASIVLYRVYVPDDPDDPEGGAGLPTVTPIAAGAETGLGFAGCSITPLVPDTDINSVVQEMNWPEGVAIPSRSASNPPEWRKFFGFGGALASIIGAEDLEPVLAGALPAGGFLNNLDNDYMSAAISREYGEVVVMRAKMPSFPDTRGGEPAWRRTQLRYWSLCQNHALTQRYVACVADYQAVLDQRRRATFVISDPDDRPANAIRERGVNWLPWGGIYPSGHLIYRQMLASPRFKRALALVEPGEPLGPILGPYLPRIAYCTSELFEREGARACLTQPAGRVTYDSG